MPIIGVCVDPTGKAKEAIVDGARSVLSDLVDWILRGYVWVMKYVIQLFMSTSIDASSSMSAVQKLTDVTGGLQVIAAGIGLLVALMQMLANRLFLVGDNAAPEAAAGMLRWAFAAALAAPILLGLSEASDALATWIFESGAGADGATHVVDKLDAALSGRDARLKTEDVIALVLSLLGLLAYVELAIQMFLQKAWLIYATAAMPIAGAASLTPTGKTVFQSLVRLACIVLLFKPIAAGFFAIAFMQIRELNSGADVVTAVLLLAAPAFIMPQVMNLLGASAVTQSGHSMLRGTIRQARAGANFARNRASNLRDGVRESRANADRQDMARSAMRATAPAPTGSGAVARTGTGGRRGSQNAPAPTGSARTTGSRANRAGGVTGTGPGRPNGTGAAGTSGRGGTGQGAANSGAASGGRGRNGADPAAPPPSRRGRATAPSSSSSGSGSTSRSARRAGGGSPGTGSAQTGANTANPPTTNRNRASRRSGGPRDTGFNRIT